MILLEVVEDVFRENLKTVEDAGKMDAMVHYLVGLVIRKTGGKAVHGLCVYELNYHLYTLNHSSKHNSC